MGVSPHRHYLRAPFKCRLQMTRTKPEERPRGTVELALGGIKPGEEPTASETQTDPAHSQDKADTPALRQLASGSLRVSSSWGYAGDRPHGSPCTPYGSVPQCNNAPLPPALPRLQEHAWQHPHLLHPSTLTMASSRNTCSFGLDPRTEKSRQPARDTAAKEKYGLTP